MHEDYGIFGFLRSFINLGPRCDATRFVILYSAAVTISLTPRQLNLDVHEIQVDNYAALLLPLSLTNISPIIPFFCRLGSVPATILSKSFEHRILLASK